MGKNNTIENPKYIESNQKEESISACELHIFCALTTAESRAKIWYQENAFKPPVT